jgi:DNA-binding CsgD family transcriptional regulator
MDKSLSARETEILKLIIYEYTTPEIAGKLFVSKETIKTHRKHLLNKLCARNVAGLVRRAFEYNMVF